MNSHHAHGLIVVLGCVAATAQAIVSESMIPEVVVSEQQAIKRQNDELATQVVAQSKTRLEEARIRAKKLDNLPHELIAASAEGRLTEDDLKKIPLDRPSTSPQAPANAAPTTTGNFYRLVLSGIGVVVFGLTLIVQRRRNAHALAPRKTR